MSLMTLFAACSSFDEHALKEVIKSESNSVNRLTIAQAEKIASDVIAGFFEGEETPCGSSFSFVEFVLRSAKTRSASANDTIAYVFNYPDNGGFVMVSPDPIVEEPLVAYSDKGHLDINDDFVKDQIIYPLEYYIETISSAPATRISVDPWHGIGGTTTKVVEWMSPELIISLDQDAPWNKVVAEVHNGKDYVTGCVPCYGSYYDKM